MSYLQEAKKLLESGKLSDMIASAEEYKRVIIQLANLVSTNNEFLQYLVKISLNKPQKKAFETLMKELEK